MSIAAAETCLDACINNPAFAVVAVRSGAAHGYMGESQHGHPSQGGSIP